MNKINLYAVFAILVFGAMSVAAQVSKSEKPQVQLPGLLMPDPKIEWKKYEENVKRGNKIMKAGITFTVTNWDKFGVSLFKPFDAKPVCSSGGEDTRMIMELYEVQTDEMVFTNCYVDAERLKSMTFYILPENKIPVCVYAVVTDRQTGRKAKSNWMDVKGGKNCFKTKNDTDAPTGSTTVVAPKKP